MVNNILSKFEEIKDYWSPKIVAEVNDQFVKIAKLKGEFVWHNHADEDELFFIVKGNLKMMMKDKTIYLNENDCFVVPKGVEHNPVADEECWVMLVEKKSTKHTGDVITEKTKDISQQY